MSIIKIDDELLDQVSLKAKESPRKRTNYNFHKSYDATVQRMLNAAEIGTYIRPHKHEDPDKVEVFIILRGSVVIVEFDNKGRPVDHIILDARNGTKGVEIPPRIWHTFIVLEKGSALYEVKEGPYKQAVDKNFAEWAPEENTPEAEAFNMRILKELGIKTK